MEHQNRYHLYQMTLIQTPIHHTPIERNHLTRQFLPRNDEGNGVHNLQNTPNRIHPKATRLNSAPISNPKSLMLYPIQK